MKPGRLIVLICIIIAAPSLLAQNYVVLGWNDLGMHCSNKDFSKFVVLPPFNNIHAQIIQVGDSLNLPSVVTTNYSITYEIPGNTYSVGKTNFWDYAFQLFAVQLGLDTGLAGAALSGNMTALENYFYVTGVPLTPYTDSNLVTEDPFQLGLLKAYDQSHNLLAGTQPVVPVSNEINCVSSGCHSSPQAILDLHAPEAGFDPAKPTLCASCHSSNALGTPGQPGLPSLSEAIHTQHAEVTNDCYKCHPGPVTQCLRDVMSTKHGFVCQTCHGNLIDVGTSIANGRIPWLQEPSCGATQCHGAAFAEEPGKLFRQSRGHGGLFCSACHGEPHAIAPSRVSRDNVQNIALQGYAGTLNKCAVCHGVVPNGAGPHGISVANCCLNAGDANHNGIVNLLDIAYMINALYKSGPMPPCAGSTAGRYPEADANGNGAFNVLDVTYMINFLYKQGPSPLCGPALLSGTD